jgi:hypothetical protein
VQKEIYTFTNVTTLKGQFHEKIKLEIFFSGLGKTNFKFLAAGVRCAQRKGLLLLTAEKNPPLF